MPSVLSSGVLLQPGKMKTCCQVSGCNAEAFRSCDRCGFRMCVEHRLYVRFSFDPQDFCRLRGNLWALKQLKLVLEHEPTLLTHPAAFREKQRPWDLKRRDEDVVERVRSAFNPPPAPTYRSFYEAILPNVRLPAKSPSAGCGKCINSYVEDLNIQLMTGFFSWVKRSQDSELICNAEEWCLLDVSKQLSIRCATCGKGPCCQLHAAQCVKCKKIFVCREMVNKRLGLSSWGVF